MTCHTGNRFGAYTCFGCHEHSPDKISKEHAEHGIGNSDDCVSCHRSGDEDETVRTGLPGRGIKQPDAGKIKSTSQSSKQEKKHGSTEDKDSEDD